jgi:hypothetical protein
VLAASGVTMKVLNLMRAKQIRMDNSLFNVLIRQAVEYNQVEKAFKLYWSLMDITKAYNPDLEVSGYDPRTASFERQIIWHGLVETSTLDCLN